LQVWRDTRAAACVATEFGGLIGCHHPSCAVAILVHLMLLRFVASRGSCSLWSRKKNELEGCVLQAWLQAWTWMRELTRVGCRMRTRPCSCSLSAPRRGDCAEVGGGQCLRTPESERRVTRAAWFGRCVQGAQQEKKRLPLVEDSVTGLCTERMRCMRKVVCGSGCWALVRLLCMQMRTPQKRNDNKNDKCMRSRVCI
jgi:hypothetical protein